MNKVKTVVFIGLVVMLALASVLSACAKTAAPVTTAPTAAPTAAPTTAAPQKIILRWISASPGSESNIAKSHVGGDYIEQQSGGRIVIEYYWAGSLVSTSADVLPALQTGVADMGSITPNYNPGIFLRTEILDIPYLCPDLEIGNKIIAELTPKYFEPEYKAKGLILVGVHWSAPAHILSKKPINSLADGAGLKISTPAAAPGQLLQSVGFVPLNMPGAETYLALQKGTIDASLMKTQGARSTKFEEICKAILKVGLYSFSGGTCLNPKRYDSLPPDLQKIVMDGAIKYFDNGRATEASDDASAWQFFTDKGLVTTTLSAQDTATLRQKAAPMLDQWVAAKEAAGVTDAGQLAKDLLSLRDKYMAEAGK